MSELISTMPTWLFMIVAIIAIVVLVGWVFLPLILMNTNAYLRRILREQQRTNELLERTQPPPHRIEGADLPRVRVDARDK